MQGVNSPGVNDFCIKLANVNGTGSASANNLLMKSFFRMGVPVMGKNYFPSNIQGLPTWYEVRVSRDGHIARSGQVDLMVAMNAQTFSRDVDEVAAGGYLLFDSTWPRDQAVTRTDINIIGVPLAKMCNEAFDGVRARILMKNVAYVGALAVLLDIDMDVIRQLLDDTFGDKRKLIDSNLKAIDLGASYVAEHYDHPLPIRAEAMDRTADHIMIDGNTAAALGCLYAGATVGAWYPITPSTSLMDAYRRLCAIHRVDPDTGDNNYCVVQAEDELAAIGMVLGAGWAGARAFTPTSGPGISLMSEFIGFGYFAEIPAVLFDVQRVGPSTGMPTRTQQGDIMACAYASHGDTRHVLLFPANPEECFYMAVQAFDLAERLQTPVIVLTDLDIGMNDWMCPTLEWDDSYRPDRGKVFGPEELEEMAVFHRYDDVDGDGIAARTLPGQHPTGAYFVRGSGHNRYGEYTEDSDEYREILDRLDAKSRTAATLVPAPVVVGTGKARRAIVSVGSCDGAVREALGLLAGRGLEFDYLRVRGFPFADDVRAFIDDHDEVYVVEQNRDAQLRSLLSIEFDLAPADMTPVLYYAGMPLSAVDIVDTIAEAVSRGAAA